MKYTPEEAPITQSISDLTAYLVRELRRISIALDSTVFIIPIQYVAPTKPVSGRLANADGTNWNPGHGAGLYVYLDGAWEKVTHGN